MNSLLRLGSRLAFTSAGSSKVFSSVVNNKLQGGVRGIASTSVSLMKPHMNIGTIGCVFA